MAFEEDLSSFVDPVSGFAVNATVGGVSVSGIFDGGYAGNNASAFGVESTSPSFTCEVSKLTGGYDEDTEVVILEGSGAGNYIVRDPEPDGLGMVTLTLSKDE
ncbi:MAG: hypothetical protein AAFX93_20405 [Verrucomicrobiota bacterium]